MDLFNRKKVAKLEALLEKAIHVAMVGERARNILAATEAKTHALEIELAVKEEQLRLLIAEDKAKLAGKPQKLHLSEDEEEIEYAHQRGDINLDEYRKLMQEQGFDNTQVDLAPEYPSDITY